MEKVLKCVTLTLVSILIIIIILKICTPSKKISTEKYISWCREDYQGYNAPNNSWLQECVKQYKKIESKLSR